MLTVDKIANGLAVDSDRLVLDKASISNQAAGIYASIWRATGQPGQGAIPTAAAVCNNTTVGCFGITNQTAPKSSYLAYFEVACSNSAMTFEIHDRLAHIGGLVGNVATAQTVNIDLSTLLSTDNLSNRIGSAAYDDVQWWLEWYTDTGSTAVTATVAVIYNDGSTGNLTGISLPATRRAGMMYPLNGMIPAAKSGLFIRAVSTVTLSATSGAAGNFGVTATRKRGSVFAPIPNSNFSENWAGLPISEVMNSSCLFGIVLTSSTSTGTLRGGGKVIHADPS